MRQITMAREPGTLRGIGPLQMCGAAISVAVEAQEWAANFFAAGGYPSVVLKSEVDMTEDEAAALKAQWVGTPANMPRVTTPNYTIEEFGANPQGAQMLQARDYQVGDVARMFGIPSSLLDYSTPGSSLTYQNLEGEFGKFVRACLWPNYLEAIEQAISDLLTRSTVARFNIDALTRSDIKTRYEVYASGITSGVLTAEEAREMEGLAPGDVENAAVPFSPPAAVPSILPIKGRSAEVRCPRGHLLAEMATPPYRFTCPKCKRVTAADAEPQRDELAAAVVLLAAREQQPSHTTVNIERGAIQNNLPPTVVNAPTTIAEGAVQVNVEPTPLTVTNEISTEPTPITIQNETTVNPTPVEVRNNVKPTPVVVNMPRGKTTKRVVRDAKNQITEIVEETTDG